MNAEQQTHPSRREKARNVLYLLVGLLVVFLIGAGWQFLRAQGLQRELADTQRQLAFTRLEATLGAATLEARRGSYDVARQLASDFYSGLQTRIDGTPDAARRHFSAVLDRRDEIITGLSRSEENAAVILTDLYLQWRSGMVAMAAAEEWHGVAPGTPAGT